MRNRFGGHLIALIIGGLLGYLALRIPEIGWVFIVATGVALSAFYLQRRRIADVGWLLLGGGGVPSIILGRDGLQAITDPSMEVGMDTWVMLAVVLTVATLGPLTLAVSVGVGRSDRAG